MDGPYRFPRDWTRNEEYRREFTRHEGEALSADGWTFRLDPRELLFVIEPDGKYFLRSTYWVELSFWRRLFKHQGPQLHVNFSPGFFVWHDLVKGMATESVVPREMRQELIDSVSRAAAAMGCPLA